MHRLRKLGLPRSCCSAQAARACGAAVALRRLL